MKWSDYSNKLYKEYPDSLLDASPPLTEEDIENNKMWKEVYQKHIKKNNDINILIKKNINNDTS